MLMKLLPVILLLIGIGAGVGAGILTAPKPTEGEEHAAEEEHEPEEEVLPNDFVKLNNQFVVPLIHGDIVTSMVVLTLSLETKAGLSELVYAREPKLRDEFLRVLFDHANTGGFRGAFTQSGNLELLRTALRETAQKIIGPDVYDVLIVDIARQDT
ncbi:MAG: flagellar basal body-associated FliL family protein [Pseudooceanicola sp.]|nr:flagellar basal body-associated FliL family protein [Pseudooceanicola sp.]